MPVLDSLLRIRTYQRQQSALALKLAQVEHERQLEKVHDLQNAIVNAHSNVQPRDALSVNDYHAWRLRQEIVMRRENARLQQRERDMLIQEDKHIHHVRDELAIQNVIEAHVIQEAEEDRRADARWMDEIASRRVG